MKNDFGILIEKYFRYHLPNNLGASAMTVSSYRYAFVHFLQYYFDKHGVIPENIMLADLSATNICSFLEWLENTKQVSVSTRNLRLAAFKSFANFVKFERPEYIATADEISKIRTKKNLEPTISYLSDDGIKILLEQPDRTSRDGIRDYAILMTFFLTGIRVSELIGIRCRDVTMQTPRSMVIHGKGSKIRRVPIVSQLGEAIKAHWTQIKGDCPSNLDNYLYRNHSNEQFTRQGINYIVDKYARMAKAVNPHLIPEDLSPHKIRHTCAMSLVDKGTELIVIRDLLGHRSITTTEIYAKLSNHRKRQAIEAASMQLTPTEEAKWESDKSLLKWLKGLGNKNIM